MVWQIAFATTSCLPSSPMSEFPPFKIRRRDASSWNALVASCLRPSVLTVSNHRMIFTYDDDTSLKLHCLQSQTKDLDWVRMQIEEQQLVTGDETKNSNTHTHNAWISETDAWWIYAPKAAKYTTVNNQGLCAGVANRMSNWRLDPLHITINDVRIHYINQS